MATRASCSRPSARRSEPQNFDWDPRTDIRTPVWETLHQLVRPLKQGGESASDTLLATFGGKAKAVRQLAYRLYTLCERIGEAEDGRRERSISTQSRSSASMIRRPKADAESQTTTSAPTPDGLPA